VTGFDPDLDAARYAPPRSLAGVSDYQRLVVNPLLAVVALLGVWVLFRFSLEVRQLGLFLATLFAGAVCPLLIQYHCLDCGRTDFALRSRRHACGAVQRRRRFDEEPPALPPSVRSQVKAWMLGFVTAGVLYAIFHHHS